MPTSDPLLLGTISNVILDVKPMSVLDIGIGYGKWGLLVREYSDCWQRQRYTPDLWDTRLVGIEIYDKYRNPAWGVYNEVVIGDALTVLQTFFDKKFDLVIMIDVLEHIEKDRAVAVLKHMRRVGKNVVVSYANTPQTGVGDNQHEDHISTWTKEEFERLGFKEFGPQYYWGGVMRSV